MSTPPPPLSSILKSASHAVHSSMQVTLHATHRKPHGASRLVQALFIICLVGENVPRPGTVVGMRGSMVIRLRPCMISSTPPPGIVGMRGFMAIQLRAYMIMSTLPPPPERNSCADFLQSKARTNIQPDGFGNISRISSPWRAPMHRSAFTPSPLSINLSPKISLRGWVCYHGPVFTCY